MVIMVIYSTCPPAALQKHEPFSSGALRGGGRQRADIAVRKGKRKTESRLEQRLHIVSAPSDVNEKVRSAGILCCPGHNGMWTCRNSSKTRRNPMQDDNTELGFTQS